MGKHFGEEIIGAVLEKRKAGKTPGKTLREIGNEFGLTKEQICHDAHRFQASL